MNDSWLDNCGSACFPIRVCSSYSNVSLYGQAECRDQKLNMKTNQGVQISACSALLFLATVLQAGAGDGTSFVLATIPTNMVMAPGQTFTNTWTMRNTGTTTWSPGDSGYTLNIASTDSLGAVPLSPRTLSGAFPPIATINGGGSVAPGATATFSMSFIAPETAGTYSDTFQMANVSAVTFGPTVTVQIVVQQAGPTGQFDRAKAVSYANNYARFVCGDGYFWTDGSTESNLGAMTPVPTSPIGDDCAHFVSCCIGSEPHQKGGGLTITTRAPPAYGEPGAAKLISTCLLAAGLATEVTSLSSLSPGDVIGWDWAGNTNMGSLDHDTLYLGNGVIAAHSTSHLDVSATTYYQSSYPNLTRHLIHILNKADTIPPTLAITSLTNGQIFASSTLAISGTASDAGCPCTGVSLVQAQMNGTGGAWQTAIGTDNWSASVSLNSGANTIYIRSKDGAGNYSTVASVHLTYNPPAPVFGGSSVSGGKVQTTLSGLSAGETVVVEASSDLQNWTPIQTNTVSGTTLSVTNTINPALPGQYFRARVR
jgi:hypothetical protein